jgi:hypothetical protein
MIHPRKMFQKATFHRLKRGHFNAFNHPCAKIFAFLTFIIFFFIQENLPILIGRIKDGRNSINFFHLPHGIPFFKQRYRHCDFLRLYLVACIVWPFSRAPPDTNERPGRAPTPIYSFSLLFPLHLTPELEPVNLSSSFLPTQRPSFQLFFLMFSSAPSSLPIKGKKTGPPPAFSRQSFYVYLAAKTGLHLSHFFYLLYFSDQSNLR